MGMTRSKTSLCRLILICLLLHIILDTVPKRAQARISGYARGATLASMNVDFLVPVQQSGVGRFMTVPIAATQSELQRSTRGARSAMQVWEDHAATKGELKAAFVREAKLLREKNLLLKAMLAFTRLRSWDCFGAIGCVLIEQ
jgi:hypothetical protein